VKGADGGTPKPHPVAPDDSESLARETTTAFAELVKDYQEHYTLSRQDAIARISETDAEAPTRVMNAPPDRVGWFELNQLAKHDAEKAKKKWEEIKQAAREEIRDGHRAARLLEAHTSQSWTRAQFIALRTELREAWRPRNAQEEHLIDQMAQFQTHVEHWQHLLASITALVALGLFPKAGLREVEAPRVSNVEAIREATELIERFQKLYLQTMQALHKLRRSRRSVLIRRANQVNMSGGVQFSVQTMPVPENEV
jgi:hypothetical protein